MSFNSLRRREGRRLRLHRRIGIREEAGYGDQARAHAAELAMHFDRAQDSARAVRYLQLAADNVMQRNACQEASDYLRRGLVLLAALPETPARVQQEIQLQLMLGPALIATRGPAAPEVERTYSRARALCAQLGESTQLFRAVRGLWSVHVNQGTLRAARGLGEELLGLARHAAAPTDLPGAHQALGMTAFFLGDYVAARTHCEQGITLIGSAGQRAQHPYYDLGPGVGCRVTAALTLWCLGYPTQARCQMEAALTAGRALGHPYSLGFAMQWATNLHHRRRDVAAVRAQAEALHAQATAQGVAVHAALGAFWRGWARAMHDGGDAGVVQMYQALAAVMALGTHIARPFCLLPLAEAVGHTGEVAEGLRLLGEVLTELESTGQGYLLPETYRLRGTFLLGREDAVGAEACFRQACDVVRRQQARSWELRAATSLGRLWHQQGKRTEAHDLVAEVYGWFTEGFDTIDLQEAHAQLDQWSA